MSYKKILFSHYPFCIFVLAFLLSFILSLFTVVPESDISRYGSIVTSFTEGDWSMVFHPRISPLVPLIAGGIAWGLLTLMIPLMPDREAALKAEHLNGSRSFDGKNACIQGVVSSSSLLYLKEDFPAERFAAFELLPEGAEKTVLLYVDRDSPMMAEFASLPILSKRLFHGKVYSEDAMIMMVLESMDSSSSSSSSPLKTSATKTSAPVMRSEENAPGATSAAGSTTFFPHSSPHSSPGAIVPVPSSSASAGGEEGISASAAVQHLPAS